MTCCCCCCLLQSLGRVEQSDTPLRDVQNVLWCSSQTFYGNLAGSCILSTFHALQQERAARKPNQTFLWVSSGLPPHLVEKLKHTIMGGSVEVSRHYYSRFSKLFSVCGSNQLRKNTSKTLLKFHMKNPSPGDVSKWYSATATRN